VKRRREEEEEEEEEEEAQCSSISTISSVLQLRRLTILS